VPRISVWLLLIIFTLCHIEAIAQSKDFQLGKIPLKSLNIKGTKNQKASFFCRSPKIYIEYQNAKKKKIKVSWSSKFSKKLSPSEKKTIQKYFEKCAAKRNNIIPPTQTSVPTDTPKDANKPVQTQTPVPTITPEITYSPTLTPTPSFIASIPVTYITINQTSFENLSSQSVLIYGICSFCGLADNLELNFQNSTLGTFSYNNQKQIGLMVSNQQIIPSENRIFDINFEALPYKAGKEDVKVTVLSNKDPIGEFTIQINIPGVETLVGSNAIFVDSIKGGDLQDGAFNSPVNTLNKAIEKAMSTFTTDPHAQVEIILGEGVHYTGYTGIDIDLSKIASDGSLIIKPLNDAKPIVFFGKKLPPVFKLPSSKWVNVGGNKWSYCGLSDLNIPQVSPASKSNDTSTTHEVITPYINGALMKLARFPNEDYLKVTNFASNIVTLSSPLPSIGENESKSIRAVISPGPQTGAIRGKATVLNNGILLDGTLIDNGGSSTTTNNPIYFEGHPAFLDSEGEYYYDNNCLTIYKTNFNPSNEDVSISSSSNNFGINLYNTTQKQNGSVGIERISFSGGASVTEFNASKGPACGKYEEAEKLSLIKLQNAKNISINYSKFGPSAIPAIYGNQNTSQISVTNSMFKNVSGAALLLVGNNLIQEPSVKEINFRNNIIQDMSPSCPNSDAIHLESVGNSNFESNTIVNSQRRGIGIFGTKYKYAVNHWFRKCKDPTYDRYSPTTNDRCHDDKSPTSPTYLPWLEYGRYNPVRNIIISKNHIVDTRDPQFFSDGGLVYTWGASQSFDGSPSVLFNKNVILNSREASQKDHLVGWYNDDGSNNVTLSDSIIASTSQSSMIPVFAKGYQTKVIGNLIYSPYESNWPMLIQNEFLAVDPPSDLITRMEFNKDLNRSLYILNNGFFQLPKTKDRASEETLYKYSELFSFNQWGEFSNFGPVVEESNFNTFSLNSGILGTKQISVNSSDSNYKTMSLSDWMSGSGDGLSGQGLDSESKFVSNHDLPSRDEMMAGTLLPKDPSIRTSFSHLEGLVVGSSTPCLMFSSDCNESSTELTVK